MYTAFAEVYDRLMDNVDYLSWSDYYARLLRDAGIAAGKVCECACGTGNLTIPLQQRGYQMTGVDLSQDMLWIAAQKARKLGLGIPFVRQDMRQLRLHRPMDAVLATCDGVNYLLEEDDLRAFFTSAMEALRPGGALLFDLSSPYKLQHLLGNEMICEDRDDITYLWQNRYSERNGTVSMHLCFFVAQGDGTYRRIDEEQTQRAWERSDLTRLLEETGYTNVHIYGNGTLESPREKEHRWHVVARRPAEIEGEAK